MSTHKRGRDDDADVTTPGGGSSRPVTLSNERFEEYYATQGVCVDDADMSEMMECFRKPLPLTFRVNARGALSRAARRRPEERVLPA